MQVKHYRQPSVREAFRAIREDLGPDALVLSSAYVSARGWRGWVGMREVLVTAQAPTRAVDNDDGRSVGGGRRPADTSRPAAAPATGVVAARLVAAGIDPALADAVAAGIPTREQRGLSAAGVRRALEAHLAPLAGADHTYAPVEVFIGPPGVGKTTTIAKIAAQERVRHGRSLGMIAADAFRAGAVEQLRTFAAIIGAPFRAARTAEEIGRAIDMARHTLLVDTAGRSPADGDLRDLRRLLARRDDVRTHLVLPGDTSVRSARRIFQTFADARPDRVVLSKLDEAEAPSALVLWLMERGIPVSYVTDGQRVPEDLVAATPAALATALLADTRALAPAGSLS
jgi:flagellar biosynthesis protein FlhF